MQMSVCGFVEPMCVLIGYYSPGYCESQLPHLVRGLERNLIVHLHIEKIDRSNGVDVADQFLCMRAGVFVHVCVACVRS